MIREATIAQRGHSAAEDAIYRRLWATGQPQADGARIAAIGAAELAEDTAMSRSTALRAVRALEAKHSIELIEAHEPITHRPRTYRVRPWAEIITARAAVGLRWAQRKPGGRVELLTDAQADEQPRASWSAAAWFARHRPAPVSAERAARKPDPPRVDPREHVAQVYAAIAHIEGVDTTTAEQLIRDCAAQPMPFDIARLMHAIQKHAAIAALPRIKAPARYLGTMVPRLYGGPGYEHDAKQQRAAELRAAELRQDAERAALAAERMARIAPAIRDAARSTWRALLEDVRPNVQRQSWETWLKPCTGAVIEGRTLYVQVPGPEFAHIGDKYGALLHQAITARGLQVEDLRFVTDEQLAEMSA